jgi:DNA uptake protein ComE-like DNA-binding protein
MHHKIMISDSTMGKTRDACRRLEINSASAEAIEKLPGITHADAMEMLRRRPFRSWENVQTALSWDSAFVEQLQQSGARVSGS